MKLVKIPSHSSSSFPELEEKETSNQTGDSLFKLVARFGLKAAAQKMLSGCLVILPPRYFLQYCENGARLICKDIAFAAIVPMTRISW